MSCDWKKIKAEYIKGGTSYRKLAEKYKAPLTTLKETGKREGWVKLRAQAQAKADAKLTDAVGAEQARKMAKVDKLADKLLEKIERAIEELDFQVVKHVDKTKTIEYNNQDRRDKPTKEVIHEEEKLVEVKGMIDRQGLEKIATALLRVKDIKGIRSDADRREQEARISRLEKDTGRGDIGGEDKTCGVVMMPPVMDAPKPPEDDDG